MGTGRSIKATRRLLNNGRGRRSAVAPLPAEEQQELRQTLIGTWEHTYSEEEDGESEKMVMFEITWTFNEDGTGVYTIRWCRASDRTRKTRSSGSSMDEIST